MYQQKEADLKPCPFCGSEAYLYIIPPHTHSDFVKKFCPDLPDCKGEAFVECTGCTAAMIGSTAEQVSKEWNRRVEK